MCNKQPRQPKVRSHLKPTIRPATGSPGIFIKPPFRRGAFFPRFIRRKQKTELGPFTSESSSILPYYRKSGIKTTVTVDISKKNAKFVRNLSCFLKPSAMKPSFRLPRRKNSRKKINAFDKPSAESEVFELCQSGKQRRKNELFRRAEDITTKPVRLYEAGNGTQNSNEPKTDTMIKKELLLRRRGYRMGEPSTPVFRACTLTPEPPLRRSRNLSRCTP